jgi:hypothetical protein
MSGRSVRMASSTTLAPGVGGELALGAHLEVAPISTHVETYSHRNQHTNKHQMNWLTPPDECLVLSIGLKRVG